MSNVTFKVKASDFLESLKVLKPAIDSTSIVAFHKHFHFEGDRIRAYSDKMDISVPSPFPEKVKGSVNADIFKAVSVLAKRADEFSIAFDGKSIQIAGAGASYKFPMSSMEDPQIDGESYDEIFSVDLDDNQVRLLGLASFGATQRDALIGVTCLSNDGDLYLASTNRQILSMLRIKNLIDKDVRFMLRPDIFAFVSDEGSQCRMSFFGKEEDGETLVAGIRFSSDRFDVSSHCLKLDPLDIPRVIPSLLDGGRIDELDPISLPDTFWPSVKMAAAVAATKFDPIEIGVHNNHITISTSSMKGTFTESFEIEDDKGIDAAVNISTENLLRAAKLSLPNVVIGDRATVFSSRSDTSDFVLFVSNSVLQNGDTDDYEEQEVAETDEEEVPF